jgi:hypothetical protein
MISVGTEHSPDSASSNGAEVPEHSSNDQLLAETIRLIRALPRAVKSGMREHPEMTLVACAAGSFALGAVVGSRVTRALALAAVSAAASQFIRRMATAKIDEYVSPLVRRAVRSVANAAEYVAQA